MSMFKEIYQIATTATLAMLISADEKTGRLTISLVPKPKKDSSETALTKDLTLCGTPEEFDAGFVDALTGYRAAREALIVQAEATKEVLDAAKAASAKKAGEAVRKASKQTKPLAKADATSDENDDDDRHEDSDATAMPAATSQNAASHQPQLFG